MSFGQSPKQRPAVAPSKMPAQASSSDFAFAFPFAGRRDRYL
jgi:hypothetical protein